jgi:CheY-like chemotaxis protein
VAINLSPVQFQLGDLAQSVRQALADTGAEPKALALELTETALLHGGERVVAVLAALRKDGIQVVLDDFGTGASSLSTLRRLAIDLVKVDRSFVRELTHAPESASVARSVIQLAHALHLPVLAEGVESEGQLQMLRNEGCDQIQGYLFSPPLDPDGLTQLLRSRRTLPVPTQPSRRRTLMLVDDEVAIISALRRLFRRDGYQLVTAHSGAEALELLASHPVDVIVSDQRMPGMTGVEFLRRTKALHPDTIRMTLSGFADLQSIIDAVNEGAIYKFLMKPWDDNRLREHVAQAFEQKELADDNRRLQAELGRRSAEQAELAQRLAQSLERQTKQAELMAAGALTMRSLVDGLPLAVLGVDPDGLLAMANPAAQALLPVSASGLGMPVPVELATVLEAATAADAQQVGVGLPVQLEGRALRVWRAEFEGPIQDQECDDPPTEHRPAACELNASERDGRVAVDSSPCMHPAPRGQLLVIAPDGCVETGPL